MSRLIVPAFLGVQPEARAIGEAMVDGAPVKATPVLQLGTVHLGDHY